MNSRRLCTLLALPAALTLAACTSSTSGKGVATSEAVTDPFASSTAAPNTGASAGGSGVVGKPTDAAGLGGLSSRRSPASRRPTSRST